MSCFETAMVIESACSMESRQEMLWLQIFAKVWMGKQIQQRIDYSGLRKATDILIPKEEFGKV